MVVDHPWTEQHVVQRLTDYFTMSPATEMNTEVGTTNSSIDVTRFYCCQYTGAINEIQLKNVK